MMWSKLKQSVEARFIPELRGRVQVFQTVWRKSNDEEGEYWFALDKVKVFSCGSMRFFKVKRDEEMRLAAEDTTLSPSELDRLSRESLMRQGMMTVGSFNELLRGALNLSLEDMLIHESPIIRGLTMLDKRFGRRRLERFDLDAEHEFVAKMHAVRIAVSDKKM